MTISEDEIVSALIEYHKQSTEELDNTEDIDYKCKVYPEAHYNHYGNRGVADLYIETKSELGDGSCFVYEIKSESAIRGSTGANEIIRQFNKMREYFFKDESYEPYHHTTFELCFTPTEYNLNHIYDNLSIYQSNVEQDISDLSVERTNTIVTTRIPDPENITPILFSSPNLSPEHRTPFKKYAKKSNSDIYERCKSFFDRL
ncbi:hypothetical protein [Halorubrum salinum]|uniref:hypothetical protein n=1 Tax=Halorubrum salinum TaxID=767517 RepID=UPI0021114737|nr:hypothetical protein [Halorubrum salinum]